VKNVNPTQSTDILGQLERQEFKVLPIRIDGAKVALHISQTESVVCYDILVFREVTQEGRALNEEATCLFHSLGKLQSLLCDHPRHISPTIQNHTISFLGKKAHLLSNETGHLITCRLHPLLLTAPSQLPPSPKILASIHPIQVLHSSALESYLSKILSTQCSTESDPTNSFQYLRKAYDKLGIARIAFIFLLGLSGVIWGISLSLLAPFLALGGVLTSVILLRRARSVFRQFQRCHSFIVQSPTALRTIHSDFTPPRSPSIESTSPSEKIPPLRTQQVENVSISTRLQTKTFVANMRKLHCLPRSTSLDKQIIEANASPPIDPANFTSLQFQDSPSRKRIPQTSKQG
jgi:hypothetical protein